jgi:riboflavin biosynthesis pyrimidine reductase
LTPALAAPPAPQPSVEGAGAASGLVTASMLAAGLVDRLQVTIFPAISGRTGLLESRTLDGHTQELVYRPTPR